MPPARALKFVERGPVVVEPVEEFRVDRVGQLDSTFVLGLATLGWKFAVLRSVHLHEGGGGPQKLDNVISSKSA